MNDDCISDFAIDGYLARELPAEQTAALESHVAGCERCRARLSALREEAEAVRETLPALPGERRTLGWPMLLALAAGVLLSIALARPWEPSAAESTEVVAMARTKGRAHLTTYLRRDDRVRVFDGESVRAGDELAFAYTTSADTHLALFDIDGGRVTAVFPLEDRTFAAEAGAGVELDVAVALDGSLDEESIVAVFCEAPQPIRILQDALGSGSALPSGCEAATTQLPKGAR